MASKKMSRAKLIAVSISVAAAVALLAVGGFQIFRILNTVVINGVKYDKRMSEINLSGSDLSADIDVLFEMKNLKSADLTNTNITLEQYETLAEKMPNCEIKWSVPMGGTTYSSSIEYLALNKNVSPSELQNIKYFNHLKTLDARGYALCDELYNVTVAVSDSDCGYGYLLWDTLCGVEITSEITDLDLSDKEIDDVSEFYEKLRFFPNISTIFVGDCKVSDEEMDQLNKAFPKNQIIWLVEFGKWQARTDLKVFSTLITAANSRKFTTKEFYPLLNYCTDLRALDLGHNKIDDLSAFSKLTKLEVLILCGSSLSDLSPLANLSNLNYLEIFDCPNITDLSPIGELKNLQELNICQLSVVYNLDALKKCTKLRFVYGGYTYPQGFSWNDLCEYFPNCKIDTNKYKSAVRGDWRKTEKNAKIRTTFYRWRKVIGYESWDKVTFSKENVHDIK